MAITLVGQAGIAGGSGFSPAAITYSSTTGNTLIITGHLYDNGNNVFVAPTSVTDSTGGTNVWQVSTNAAQTPFTAQTPPTCSLTDPSDGGVDHQCDFVAWCVNAHAVTSVTLAWEGAQNTWRRVALTEWSGIVQFDNSWANGSTSGATSVTSGPLRLNVPGELVIGALDFGGGGTESFPAGWTGLTSGGGGNAYDLPGQITNGAYSPVWTNTTSSTWTGALAVFSPGPVGAVPLRQPVRASITLPPRGHRHASLVTVASSPAPPATGPAFYPLRHPARAVIGQNAPRGHVHARSGAPLANPTLGPPFRLPSAPAQARHPLPPRGHVHKNAGAPVQNPAPPIAPFGPLRQPVRTRIALPPRGHRHANAGAPLANPTHGPAIPVLPGPAGIRVVYVRAGHSQSLASPPPPTLAPVYPLQRPVRAPIPQVFSKGRATGNPGAPVRNLTHGPAVRPLTAPVCARLPYPFRKGRAAGAGVAQEIGTGPPFPPLTAPARARIPRPFSKGRATGSPGAPVVHAGPAVVAPGQPVRARQPLPRRGRAAGNTGALIRNPTPGPAVRPLTAPAQARQPLPPRGRIAGSMGAPVQNPSPVTGAPFAPLRQPARIRITLPPRGRTESSPGAPLQNAPAGPPTVPPRQPVRARRPLPPRGRAYGNAGAPLQNPPYGPHFTGLTQPVRAPIPQTFSKGRAAGAGVSPEIQAGPPLAPLNAPVRARIPQPFSKGHGSGSAGAPVVHAGPPVYPLAGPVAGRLPQLHPRAGRAAGSKGAPVNNPVLGPAPVYPPNKALHAQPPVFLKGRIASGPGAPVHNSTYGPAFPALQCPVQARALPKRGGTAAWRYGTYAPPAPPPSLMPGGVLTITPAGPLAAVVTISPAGAQTAVATAQRPSGSPSAWPPVPPMAYPPPRPLVYPPSG